MNPAAVEAACLGVPQRIRMMSGDRMIPPPIPTIPESKPITAPLVKASQVGGGRVDCLSFPPLAPPIKGGVPVPPPLMGGG